MLCMCWMSGRWRQITCISAIFLVLKTLGKNLYKYKYHKYQYKYHYNTETSADDNIALNKAAYQSSDFYEDQKLGSAAKAVDGNSGTSFRLECCDDFFFEQNGSRPYHCSLLFELSVFDTLAADLMLARAL